MSIAITHSPAEGTLVLGTAKGDGSADTIKAHGFRWSRNIGSAGAWFRPNSRDRSPNTPTIDSLAGQLGERGFVVTVKIDDTARSAAERVADRRERLEDRQDALDAKAERLGAQADGLLSRARDMASIIPLGQPILVGHHSERRDRNYRARIDRTYDKAFETGDEAREAARKADASRATLEHREGGPATIRRIERLEAELRDVERKLTPCKMSGRKMKPEAEGRTLDCPHCYQDVTIVDRTTPVHGGASGEWAERLNARKAELTDEIIYWQAHLAAVKAAGFHEYGPADFQVGDRVNDRCTVVRVNKKSLTVQHDVFPNGHHNTLPYNKVTSVTRTETA